MLKILSRILFIFRERLNENSSILTIETTRIEILVGAREF